MEEIKSQSIIFSIMVFILQKFLFMLSQTKLENNLSEIASFRSISDETGT